mgnify:CR=1 FL=1
MALSGSSLIRMEDVAAQAPGSWFQAYLPGDEPRTVALVERVANSGFDTMVITLDTAIAANAEAIARRWLAVPEPRSGKSFPTRPTTEKPPTEKLPWE